MILLLILLRCFWQKTEEQPRQSPFGLVSRVARLRSVEDPARDRVLKLWKEKKRFMWVFMDNILARTIKANDTIRMFY